MSRFRAPLVAAFLALSMAGASAQSAPQSKSQTAPAAPPADAPKGKWLEPPDKLPKAQRGDVTKNLDFLFEALKIAPDDASASAIEQRIWALWYVSRSDTANLLMTRAKTAIDAQDYDLALQFLDVIVDIKPDYVEAWNRRATVYFLKKDYGASLSDIRQVLNREPRHFGALAGLGLIMQEFGDERHALEVYRRALEIHPHLQKIPDIVKTLSEKVEGRDI
jgi:tetratricopeptide (TPR) repeat protein